MEVAGANRRWRCQFRYRGSRRESAVAQLSTLAALPVMRTFKKLVIVGVAFGVGWFAYAFWRGHSYERAYAAVLRGDSEARVLQLFGRPPRRISGQPKNVAWDTDGSVHANGGECVREFWYVPPIAVAGEAWTIGFDEHSNVVSKYHYVSP
jgi:hypothetical protein